jgi:hypothetical protein
LDAGNGFLSILPSSFT